MIETKEIGLQEWAIANEPSKEMHFYEAYWHQVMLIRDRFTALVFGSRTEGETSRTVISSHVSKSVRLPVYQMVNRQLGLTLTMRGNFHDWKVSVESDTPITCDFMDLFDKDAKWSFHYCEGFPHERIFGSYQENKQKFTVELYDEFSLHTFLWLLVNHLKANGSEVSA